MVRASAPCFSDSVAESSASGRHRVTAFGSARQKVPLCETSTSQRVGLAISPLRIAPKRARGLKAAAGRPRPPPARLNEPGPRRIRVPVATRTVTISPACRLTGVPSAMVRPGGSAFAEGPAERTTRVAASPVPATRAAARMAAASGRMALSLSGNRGGDDVVALDLGLGEAAPGRAVGTGLGDRLLLVHDLGQQLARHAHADEEIIVLAGEQGGILLDSRHRSRRLVAGDL